MKVSELLKFENVPAVSLLLGSNFDDLLIKITSKFPAGDVLNIPEFNMAESSKLKDFCSSVPFGNFKVAVINLNGSSLPAQHSMLTLLETLSSTVKIIMTSSGYVLPTLKSRSFIFKTDSKVDNNLKSQVLKVLAATKNKDVCLLDSALKDWSSEGHELLKIWALESMSRKFVVFSAEEMEILNFNMEFPKKLLMVLQLLKFSKYQWSVRSVMLTQIGA